ncbi:MAG: phosphoenolpyruvate--protein phosphotransferase [Spirochaetia bacterium]|jgi:phosphotransferase system enzyme I (PtsI)|nr:phosphoenolpyruvate--protein phosphotransferase [Spirochaetia bacterium]
MRELRGVAASPGAAIASAFLYSDDYSSAIPAYSIQSEDASEEFERYKEAVAQAKGEVKNLREKALTEAGEEQAAIFDAHLLMLDDPDVLEQVQERLHSTLMNVESIVFTLEQEMIDQLSSSQDPYIQERVSDVHDVIHRVLGHLLHRERFSLGDLENDVILVARDLLPSDMVGMARTKIRGIALEAGGRTSHAAILARAFGIPAVLGLGPFMADVQGGSSIIVDGDKGLVVIDPDEGALKKEKAARSRRLAREKEFSGMRDFPAATKDGQRILLKANIEVPEELEAVLEQRADGIGLFRSEFLFLGGHIPGEEAQFKAYKKVVEGMEGKPVTIRTLDIGGDKVLPELGAQDEKNPLLGWRAIRFCLSKTDIFRTQLRALLRAAAFGDLRIMFPMISTVEELVRARGILEEAQWECRMRGLEVPAQIKAGIMIEVPSAALCSDILARSADFFSIGTNDLIQYTMAVDRGNEKVAYLHDPFNPAVLRLIRTTIEAAKKAKIEVSLCGEMGADPLAALLLVGMGLRELSMSAVSIPFVKSFLFSQKLEDAENLAEAVTHMTSSTQVATYIASRFKA